MTCIGETKPHLTEEKQQIIKNMPFAKPLGKKKWKCPECGYKRTGDESSMADLKEEFR